MSPKSPPSFDLNRIQHETFVECIEYREKVDSTNNLALEMSGSQSVKTPMLVLAARQTDGRGRGANLWWTADGSLNFSLVLDTHGRGLPVRNWPKISLATGLAIARVLRLDAAGFDVRLKWPNDVYLQSRKVSGVLVESSRIRREMIVIGAGINVNNSLVDAPGELRETATSLCDVHRRRFDRTELLVLLLGELEAQLSNVAGDASALARRWREFCMLTGRRVQVDSGTRSVAGVCQGIDDEGALLLQTETGVARCMAGVVARID